jgi:hypothetical protein
MPMQPRHPAWCTRARADQVERHSGLGQVGEDLPGTGVDVEAHHVAGLAAPHHRGGHGVVAEPRIGRGSMTTWLTGSPATSRTDTTLPGEEGFAISGSTGRADRGHGAKPFRRLGSIAAMLAIAAAIAAAAVTFTTTTSRTPDAGCNDESRLRRCCCVSRASRAAGSDRHG